MTDHDTMFIETIARHFDGARIHGNVVDLGIGGLHVACKVNRVGEIGQHRYASLFFELWGGALGEAPIFASMSGYGGSAEEAIITGGCNWACAFGPVLTTALAGAADKSGEVHKYELLVHGRKYLAFVAGLDRAMFIGGDAAGDGIEVARVARAHLGAQPCLATRIIESGTLPVLPADRATVLSVFCFESTDRRTLEVKVNGADWSPSQRILDNRPPLPTPGSALLREFAVLVPQGEPAALTRALLSHTLAGAAAGDDPRDLTAWPGWAAHGGRVGEPASNAEVERLESKIGRLPEDYRAFLLNVQTQGAGPGHGLISPFSAAQAAMATGEFDWNDGEQPQSEPSGVLVLAHAGCGVMWLLVTRGPARGEVWVDAAGSDGLARRVAPSFDAWYRAWLDALVRNDSVFAHWDSRCCATPSALSQMLDSLQAQGMDGDAAVAELPNRLGAGAIGITSSGQTYFDQGDAIDPCQPCCKLVTSLGLGLDRFRPGVAPRHA